MALSKTFYSTFPGLNTSDNTYRLPEGSFTKALNVTIIKENIVEPRHGLPPWDVYRYSDNVAFRLKYELAHYAPRQIGIADLTKVGSDYFLTMENVSLFVGDFFTLSLISGSLPTGYIGGNLQVLAQTAPNTYQISGLVSVSATAGSRYYVNQFYNGNLLLKNMFFWRDNGVDRYIVIGRDTEYLRVYMIKPKDYFNLSETSTYNLIKSDLLDTTFTNTSPYIHSRFITSNKGLYISEPEKWIVLRNTTFPLNTPEEVKQAIIGITNVTLVDDATNNWLKPGYAVRIKAVGSRILNDGSELEGQPSEFYEITNNTGRSKSLSVTLYASLEPSSINIYRTVQYQASAAISTNGVVSSFTASPPSDYFLAGSTSTFFVYAGLQRTATAFLNFNDDLIQTTGNLYTNPGLEGDIGANMDMPLCNEAYNFKGHTFFADTLTLPTATIDILSLQATTTPVTSALAGNSITISGLIFPFVDQTYPSAALTNSIVVATNPPATLGDISQTYYGNGYGLFDTLTGQYTAAGFSDTPITTRRMRIRPYNAATGRGDVVPDGTSTFFEVGGGNFTVTSADLNFSKFNVAGGGLLYTTNDITGASEYTFLVRYEKVEQVANTVIFKNYTLLAQVGTSGASTTAPIYLFYIPGTSPQNLPLFIGSGKIGVNDTVGDPAYAAYFSLLPSAKRMPTPVAKVSSFIFSPGLTSTGGDYINTTVFTIGASDRSASQLIAATAVNMARTINQFSGGAYSARTSGEVGQVVIRSEKFQTVTALVSSLTIGPKFNPALTTSPITISNNSKERVKNGVIVSKQGNPEIVPISSYLVPQPVGNSQNRISRMASLKDTLYFFKENEGIYSCSIQAGNGEFPSALFNEIVPFDLTIKPLSPESVKIIDDQIIFLADKGFARIKYGSVGIISTPIDIEVKINSARTPDLEKVTAYVDPVKRLYVCHLPNTTIPGYGTTYVFNLNSEQWSTSDVQFDWGVTDTVGRVTTIQTDYRLVDDPVSQLAVNTSDQATPKVVLSNYLRQEQLTGRVPGGIVTEQFDTIITEGGNELVILRQAVNILNSSYDQFDEKLTGFSDIIITGLGADTTATLSRTTADFGLHKDYSLRWFSQRLRDKQLYMKTLWNGMAAENVAVTIIDAGETATSNYITVSFPANTVSVNPNPTIDSLLVGVNASMEFAPYHLGSPHTIKQWSEGQFHFQDRAEPASLPILLSASYAVDNQQSFSTVTPIERRTSKSGVYRVLVPLTASRGRYLRIKLEHNIPENYFQMQGVTVAVKGTSSVSTTQQA